MSVVYLLASLPMLTPERPAISVDAFISACETSLSESDVGVAKALLRGEEAKCKHPFAAAWRDVEAAVQVAVGKRRLAANAARTAQFAPPEQQTCPVWIQRAVDDAFTVSPDPMAREAALLKIRWEAVETLAGVNPLSKEQLFAYAVKLRLVTRWASLNSTRGQERLEAALPKQTL